MKNGKRNVFILKCASGVQLLVLCGIEIATFLFLGLVNVSCTLALCCFKRRLYVYITVIL